MTGLTPEEQSAFEVAASLAAEGRTLPLVMEPPRRGRPPTHWIDLTVEQRQTAIAELGLPKFRASQLSRQLFSHFNERPEQWTDIPKDERELLASRLVQPLIDGVRDQVADAG
ncbi:MAG TPA: 23S rRNA (adenine(2503)-C(2))-methyltransferase RlmN, partial [Propionibacteriaceae bacterium]|nr:23S rRNA (adenine(2503)-C(2))-methyltransferase RlmN [Propionibacteriaceae bacterium]